MRIATWNIEYLLEPSTYAALAGSCVKDNSRIPGAVRQIPCDIVPQGDRKEADFAAPYNLSFVRDDKGMSNFVRGISDMRVRIPG